MSYPWVITKIKELITGVANNSSDITILTPTPPPIGGIIDYYGGLDSSGKYPMTEDGHINYNWHVCDGTDGTPDLVGKTVIGASSDTYGSEGGSETVTPSVTVNSATQSVTVNGHTLTQDEMPVHTHYIQAGYPYYDTPSGQDVIEYDQFNRQHGYINNMYGPNSAIIANAGGSYGHTHGVSTSAHSHTLNIGTHTNLPPYKALYKVMRVA